MITLPTASEETLRKFLLQNRKEVYGYIVREIGIGVKEGAERVVLFKFGETQHSLAVERSSYLVALQEALDFFIGEELYEQAIKCRDIILIIQEREDKSTVEDFLQNI